MKILFVESDQMAEYNCSNWRCVIPSMGLSRAGIQSRVVRIEPWMQRDPECVELTKDADIIFVQRNTFNEVLNEIFYWRHNGKIVVVDLDDAYEYMTENTGSPSYELWINSRIKQEDGKYLQVYPRPLDQLKWGVQLAGALSSPSGVICDDWKQYARTYLFPNYIDRELYTRRPVYHPSGRILIGWGGSMTHLLSWQASGIADACRRIITERKNVDLFLLGDPRVQKFIDVPPSRKMAIGWVSSAEFGLRMCVADIGVIPLYGEYDRRRSWIKSLEFTSLGTPWLGTNMEPNQTIKTGRLVENGFMNWYTALNESIDNLPELKDQATENVKVGDAYAIQNNIDNLVTLFKRIIKEGR